MIRLNLTTYDKRSRLPISVLMAFILLPMTIHGEQIYKYVDDKGVVSYSTQPPENAQKVKQLDVSTKGAPLSASERQRRVEQFRAQHRQNMARSKSNNEQAQPLQEQVVAAKREVAVKEKALAEGQEPQPGERQAYKKAGGGFGSRLKPEYFSRIKKLEDELIQARKKLDDLRQK